MASRIRQAEDLGKRLRQAIADSGMTQDKFITRMGKLGEKGERLGTSRRTIYSYFKGAGSTPSLEFIVEAARFLDVTPNWLAFGEGPKSERTVEVKGWLTSWEQDAERQMAEGFPAYDRLSQTTRSLLRTTRMRYLRLNPDATSSDFGRGVLEQPLRAFGLDPATVPRPALNDHLQALALSFRFL